MSVPLLYDITTPITPELAEWPGDTPYRYEWIARLSDGASVNLGTVTMSVHLGTHMDAPFHYSDTGKTVEQIDPGVFIGPAMVVDVRGRALITVADVAAIDLTGIPRILFKTDGWQDRTQFPTTIPLLDTGVPEYLCSQGVILVGMDVPSLDHLDSKDLPIHHALGRAGITILESIVLRDVPPGRYELIALPLKIVGADGSPVRAILREVTS